MHADTPDSLRDPACGGPHQSLEQGRPGLLIKADDGSFAVADRAKATQVHLDGSQDTTKEPTQDATQEALASPELETSITEVATKVQPGEIMACINSVASTGEFDGAALDRAAAQMNLSPEAARDQAETIRAGFEAQARAAVEASGFDSEEVFSWAWEQASDKLKAAMVKQATERTTKGYQEIVKGYTMALDKANPDAILNAQFPEGVSAKRLGDGTILLKTPMGEVEWKTAVRNGWVKVGRA